MKGEIMVVRDLNREQLNELKLAFLCEKAGGTASYVDLADAEDIPDETIFSHYEGIEFTEDDFFCGHA